MSYFDHRPPRDELILFLVLIALVLAALAYIRQVLYHAAHDPYRAQFQDQSFCPFFEVPAAYGLFPDPAGFDYRGCRLYPVHSGRGGLGRAEEDRGARIEASEV